MNGFKLRIWDKQFECNVSWLPDGYYIALDGLIYLDGGIETKTLIIERSSGEFGNDGVEVFEGDIVQVYHHCDIKNKHVESTADKFSICGNSATYTGEMPDIRTVIWHRGSLALYSQNGGHNNIRYFGNMANPGESVKVIGHRFKNQELLNGHK